MGFRGLLRKRADKGISLKRSKFIFAQPEASFCGYILFGEGYRSDPSLVKALAEFPIPQNITDLRSFFWFSESTWFFYRPYRWKFGTITLFTKV